MEIFHLGVAPSSRVSILSSRFERMSTIGLEVHLYRSPYHLDGPKYLDHLKACPGAALVFIIETRSKLSLQSGQGWYSLQLATRFRKIRRRNIYWMTVFQLTPKRLVKLGNTNLPKCINRLYWALRMWSSGTNAVKTTERHKNYKYKKWVAWIFLTKKPPTSNQKVCHTVKVWPVDLVDIIFWSNVKVTHSNHFSCSKILYEAFMWKFISIIPSKVTSCE